MLPLSSSLYSYIFLYSPMLIGEDVGSVVKFQLKQKIC